jgi:nitroreductase
MMSASAARDGAPAPFAPEDVAVLVRAATAAPSIHNSQPWLFRDEPDRIELWLDARRPLAVADPAAREQVISCGAALYNLRLAMGHLRHEPLVTLLPNPDDLTHLATVGRGPRRGTSALEARLYAAVYRRRSHRRPFGPEPVPRALLDELAEAAAWEGAWAHQVETPDDRVALVDLAAGAAHWLLSDPGYRGELARWTRTGTNGRDGVRLEALGSEQYPVSGLPWALMADPEIAVGELERHPMLVLGTDRDGRADWLHAGQALQRVLLTATARGLAASLFTQVLEVPATRSTLRRRLRLPGIPQLVLRLGYPLSGVPASARRALDTVFVPHPDQPAL